MGCYSCVGHCGTPSDLKNGRMCSCDKQCMAYKDCCSDFHICKDKLGGNLRNFGSASCVNSARGTSFLLASSCFEHEKTYQMTFDSIENFVPIYDIENEIHYINYKCAFCNGVSDILPWDIVIKCKEKTLSDRGYNLSDSVHENEFEDLWSLLESGECEADFIPPEDTHPRICKEAKRDCNEECKKENLANLCSQSDLVYYRKDCETYGNIYCLFCNGIFDNTCPKNEKDGPLCQRGILPKPPQKLQPDTSKPPQKSPGRATEKPRQEIGTEQEFQKPPFKTSGNKVSFRLLFSMKALSKSEDNNEDIRTSVDTSEIPEQESFIRREYIIVVIVRFKSNISVDIGNISASIMSNVHMLPDNLEMGSVAPRFDYLMLSVTFFSHITWNTTHNMTSAIKVLLHEISQAYTIQSIQKYKLKLNCSKTKTDDFEIGFNGTAFVKGRAVLPGDYLIENKSLILCKKKRQKSPTEAALDAMDIVNISFSCLSMVALIVRILLHLCLPSLSDRVANRLVVCLAFSLLVAFSAFLLRVVASPSEWFCYLLGVTSYWAFIAAFCWMACISFDITLILRSSYKVRKIGSRNKAFIVYAVFSLGFPTAISSLSVILNHVDTSLEFKANFSLHCWISTEKGLLLYFVLPAALLVLLSVVFFVTSTVYLYLTSSKIKSSRRNQTKSRLFLHLKIFLLMGLAWVFGFLASAVEQDWMWYLFILLNSSQGVFLLVVYLTSRNVKSVLREKMYGATYNIETQISVVEYTKK